MSRENKDYAHPELVGGGETSKHSHAGGGGADVKSGVVTGISESSQKQVNFSTAFNSVPHVVAAVKAEGGNYSSSLCIENISVNGFEISTKGDNCNAYWIATDAGDP